MTDPSPSVVDWITPGRTWRVSWSSFVRLLGLGWLGAAGWLVGSELSLAVGVGLVVLGLIARPLITVAVGHPALIPIVPDLLSASSLVSFGLFEGGLLLLLVSERPTNPVVAVLTGSGAAALAATAGVAVVEFGLAAGSTLIVVALATVSGLLYWYERQSVRQLVDDRTPESTPDPTADRRLRASEQRAATDGSQETTQS